LSVKIVIVRRKKRMLQRKEAAGGARFGGALFCVRNEMAAAD